MEDLYTPSTKAMIDSTLRVLYKLERKDKNAISEKWRDEMTDKNLSISDAIALIYVAIDRGLLDSK